MGLSNEAYLWKPALGFPIGVDISLLQQALEICASFLYIGCQYQVVCLKLLKSDSRVQAGILTPR